MTLRPECGVLGAGGRSAGLTRCDGQGYRKAQKQKTRWGRRLVLLCSGGMLVQFAGCATGIVPVLLSAAESAILSSLLGSLAGP